MFLCVAIHSHSKGIDVYPFHFKNPNDLTKSKIISMFSIDFKPEKKETLKWFCFSENEIETFD